MLLAGGCIGVGLIGLCICCGFLLGDVAEGILHIAVQRCGVFLDVLRDQRAGWIGQQRDALIETAVHFPAEHAGGVAELHGE